MSIIIETEKVVDLSLGGKARRISRIRALKLKDLPNEYIRNYPHCFFIGGYPQTLLVVDKREGILAWRLSKGDIISETAFQHIFSIIKKAGDRLSAIRKKQKEIASKWDGTETFSI